MHGLLPPRPAPGRDKSWKVRGSTCASFPFAHPKHCVRCEQLLNTSSFIFLQVTTQHNLALPGSELETPGEAWEAKESPKNCSNLASKCWQCLDKSLLKASWEEFIFNTAVGTGSSWIGGRRKFMEVWLVLNPPASHWESPSSVGSWVLERWVCAGHWAHSTQVLFKCS